VLDSIHMSADLFVSIGQGRRRKIPPMRLPNSAHTSRPWRIHELTRDFRLEDVWELPGRGSPDDFPRLVELIASRDPSKGSSRAARALWAIRWKLGELLGWDDPDAGLGSRVPTLRDRLPADLREGRSGPDFDALPFTPLYLTESEFAAEIANRTMHGVMHIGRVPDGSGGYRAQLAVLVKPNGRFGTAYMAVIRPFRHLIVYPAAMRGGRDLWERAGDPTPRTLAQRGRAEAPDAEAVVEEFLSRQREMYAGGDLEAVQELLAEDVVWHVPGTSPIAGDYRGREAVTGYFRLRRGLAGGAIRVAKRGEAHHDEALVQLADGRAPLGGREVLWRTAGVYRVADGRIAEAWLVPLDQEHFDRVWGATRPAPFVSSRRVRPQECAASSMLGQPRLLEFLEAAFLECWHDRFGQPDASLGPDRRLTVAAVNIRYLAPVRAGDELRIEVALDRITERSIQVHYDAFVEGARVAEGGSRYVWLDAESGEPTSLPDSTASKQEAAAREPVSRINKDQARR
jgi:acyl-CoA thioesterase FadM/ketosteroid isomerase-like protein